MVRLGKNKVKLKHALFTLSACDQSSFVYMIQNVKTIVSKQEKEKQNDNA